MLCDKLRLSSIIINQLKLSLRILCRKTDHYYLDNEFYKE